MIALLVAVTTVVLGVASPGQGSTCPSASLALGQHIAAGTTCSKLTSPNGHFVLNVDPNDAAIDQKVHATNEPAGTLFFDAGPSWRQSTYHLASNAHLELALRAHGNLVLITPVGHVLWSTNTEGKGVTRATLQNNGQLALLTSSGARVWASNSGIYALGGGDRLGPGHRLIQTTYDWACDSCNQGQPLARYNTVTVSVMQTNGDFVARCPNSTRVAWHTNTHSPNSYLTLLDTGALVVKSPAGRILWSSPTRGWRYVISTLGTQVIAGTSHVWNAPEGAC